MQEMLLEVFVKTAIDLDERQLQEDAIDGMV